jgi:transposase-like protein
MRRQSYSREQWLSWISEQASSGLSIAEFCQTKGLPVNSFYNWRNKLTTEGDEKDPSLWKFPGPFVPVSVRVVDSVEIDLPCGATVRLPADQEATRRVLGILLQLGSQSLVPPGSQPRVQRRGQS